MATLAIQQKIVNSTNPRYTTKSLLAAAAVIATKMNDIYNGIFIAELISSRTIRNHSEVFVGKTEIFVEGLILMILTLNGVHDSLMSHMKGIVKKA